MNAAIWKKPDPRLHRAMYKELPKCFSVKHLYAKVGKLPEQCYLYFCEYYYLTQEIYNEAKEVKLQGFYCSYRKEGISELISEMSADRVVKQWEEAEAFKKRHGIEFVFWRNQR